MNAPLGFPTRNPRINGFYNKASHDFYGTSGGTTKEFSFGQHIMPATANRAPIVRNTVLQHPALADSCQATLNMRLWLQESDPALHSRIPGLGHVSTMVEDGTLPTHSMSSTQLPARQVSTSSATGAVPRLPTYRKHVTITRQCKTWDVQVPDQMTPPEQERHSVQELIADLKHRLAEQQKLLSLQLLHSVGSPEQLNTTSSSSNQSDNSYGVRPYQASLVMSSPMERLPSINNLGTPSSPTKTTKKQPPQTPHKHGNKTSRRHHRTATPEQRSIRVMMGNKPVFTMGMDPQDDRCLIYDFFEHIKQWAVTYTVHIRSLNAEQVHNLAAHPAIVGVIANPSQLRTLVTEKDMLIAMVAGVICRHMWAHALDEHAMYASNHIEAELCEELARQWATLPFAALDAKHELLLHQQRIYTNIKNAPDHKAWRASCAEHLTCSLLADLAGLLATNLAAAAVTERNHKLSELYVKGYRIGFRLRMAALKWQFQWPAHGTEFSPGTMVNESRMLYGDVLSTMNAVMHEPRAHEVVFAVSPTVCRNDYSEGVEKRVVVHNALVHITRKGYA